MNDKLFYLIRFVYIKILRYRYREGISDVVFVLNIPYVELADFYWKRGDSLVFIDKIKRDFYVVSRPYWEGHRFLRYD